MNLKQTNQLNQTPRANSAPLQADYKRIIETNLNLNQQPTPALTRYKDIVHAVETEEYKNFDLAPMPNWTPNANYCATAHLNRMNNVKYYVREFIAQQERITDKRNKYKKIRWSRSHFLPDNTKQYKQDGLQLAKVIHNANKPPLEVEQDRRMIDYTLRACEYLRRAGQQKKEIRDKLEPNLDHIDKQFTDGDWCSIDWFALGMNSDNLNALNYLHHLHRVHVSLKNPLQIAHYPTLRHLRERREVITKLGKYLTTFKDFIGLDDADIKNHVEKYQAIIASRTGWEISFIESNDADGFYKVYRDCKAGSCMKGEEAVKVYAHDKSVLRLAYMRNIEGEIIARCIVREDRKQYIRVYPEANGSTEGRYLQDFLKANGYTHGNLEGVLLEAIEHEDDCEIYVAPYIDAGKEGNGAEGAYQSGDLVEIDGKDYIQVVDEGQFELTYTNGYTNDVEDDEDYSDCEDCGGREHNDNFYSTYHDRYVCEGCINENYTYAHVRNGQDYVANDDVVEVGGEWYHVDYLDRYDIYYCEETESYHHIDDLVSTSRGFIHVDWSISLDHEDPEGNTEAHRDDAHELSNGKWCHVDDAYELQKEIDDADKEDDVQAEILERELRDKQSTSDQVAQLTQGLLR